MKILIAGLGSIGRRHFRNLRALGEEDILLYRTHQSTLPEDELAGFPVETELSKALAHCPDGVVVSNPTALHLDVSIPAAEAGCHLLLEKPLSHSMERVDELVQAVTRGGGQVLVGFQFRYHPGLRWAERLLSEGAIGRPLSVRSHWGEYLPRWHPWEDYRQGYAARSDLGGGVVLTLCHPLDYLHWLFGKVNNVFAFTAQKSDLGINVEDSAEIGLRFENGMVGSVHLNYNQRPPAHTLEIVGTEGMIRWDNADGVLRLYQEVDQTWESFTPPEGFERNWLFVEQMRHFLAVIRKEDQPLCTLEDGIYALRLSLAALASAHNGSLQVP